jgi:hypothetical protein
MILVPFEALDDIFTLIIGNPTCHNLLVVRVIYDNFGILDGVALNIDHFANDVAAVDSQALLGERQGRECDQHR